MGHLECVRLLLENCPDPDLRDDSLRTPLHTAAYNGHEAIARLLIDAGANPNLRYDCGWTPAQEAGRAGRWQMRKYLRGCELLDAPSKFKIVRGHKACYDEDYSDIMDV